MANIAEICEQAYLAFRTDGKEGLPLDQYWHEDAVMTPMFEVAGWKAVKGREAILQQLANTKNFPGLKGFQVMPTKFDVVGNAVYVHEDVKTDHAGSFKGLAIHEFDTNGKCVKVTPIHDSFKMTYKENGEDLIAKMRLGYEYFGNGDVENLSKMFTPDASMTPQFPVKGWETASGFHPFMQQFAAMEKYPQLKGFKPTPYDMKRCGNTVFVYEDVVTEKCSFKGLAVFSFNDQGLVYNCTPYHNSKMLSSNN